MVYLENMIATFSKDCCPQEWNMVCHWIMIWIMYNAQCHCQKNRTRRILYHFDKTYRKAMTSNKVFRKNSLCLGNTFPFKIEMPKIFSEIHTDGKKTKKYAG